MNNEKEKEIEFLRKELADVLRIKKLSPEGPEWQSIAESIKERIFILEEKND